MAHKEARRPDYVVIVKQKDSDDAKGVSVGAGWKVRGPYGDGVSIKLNPGVRLSWDDALWISIWPHRDLGGAPPKRGEGLGAPVDAEGPYTKAGDDEPPFG